MDPASATVAFIGFSASLATITAVIIDSVKTLHNVCKSFKHAPDDIQRLYKKIKRLEEVILEMKIAASQFCDPSIQLNLDQYWASHAIELEADLSILKTKILGLHTTLQKKSHSKLHSLVSIRKFFSEEEIQFCERIIASHMESFSFMLSLYSNYQTKSLLQKFNSHSSKIDHLISSTSLLHTSIRGSNRETSDAQSYVRANASPISAGIIETFIESIRRSEHHEELCMFQSLNQIRADEGPLSFEEIAQQSLLQNVQFEKSASHIFPSSYRSQLRDPIQYPRRHDMAASEFQSIARGSRRAVDRRSIRIDCKVSLHRLPIGILTVYRKESSTSFAHGKARNNQSHFSIEFRLFPVPWIAKRMVYLSFGYGTSAEGTSSLSWGFKQAAYNENTSLTHCLKMGDLSGLQKLFEDGTARPTDLLAPWGNSLLHEVVFGFASGVPNSYEICEFLLDEGADLNTRNSCGQTPLLLCSRLMNETVRLELQTIATLLVSRGADLAVCDPRGFSVCSEIFQSPHGLQYFESFLHRHVDLFTLEQMASVDAWILGGLARSFSTFRACLENHLFEYRTPPAISSCLEPHTKYIKELDVEQQLIEVKQAPREARTGFLKTLCAKGTVAMVQPFLGNSIDLDELSDNSSISYIRAAAKNGNVDVVMTLLQAGASLHCTTIEQKTPVDDFLERWFSLRIGRPEYFGDPESEYWILQELLRNPTFHGPNVLLLALQTRQPPFIFKRLLDAGCGQKGSNPPASWELKRLGSEVNAAVQENNPILPRFLEYGLSIESEDRLGFTALLHALDRGKGSLDFTKVLIDAGADVARRTGSGYTPLEFARKNLQAEHPRVWRRWGQSKRSWQLHAVTEEEDREAYMRIKTVLRQRKGSQKSAWLDADSYKHAFYTGGANLVAVALKMIRTMKGMSLFVIVLAALGIVVVALPWT